MRTGYKAAIYAAKAASGTNPFAYARDYKLKRGMDIDNDIHDWLGGYPYESACADYIRGFVTKMGFSLIRENVRTPTSGLLGTGCDEFVFRRTGAII
jgi:2-polyprenyl-6-hydroxyphenyl methylase/3-demethylubiquinone-9 3-methyltransferase